MTDAVLRTLDKIDKIGVDGVIALLQKPEAEFGAGLDPFIAEWIGDFARTKGADNRETLANMRAWFANAPVARGRLELMIYLETTTTVDGRTLWDDLLAMAPNDDETWANGGRPRNVGWALDDLLATKTPATE